MSEAKQGERMWTKLNYTGTNNININKDGTQRKRRKSETDTHNKRTTKHKQTNKASEGEKR